VAALKKPPRLSNNTATWWKSEFRNKDLLANIKRTRR